MTSTNAGTRVSGYQAIRYGPNESVCAPNNTAALKSQNPIARPGDFILTHSSGIYGALVRFGEAIRYWGLDKPFARWSHAAISLTIREISLRRLAEACSCAMSGSIPTALPQCGAQPVAECVQPHILGRQVQLSQQWLQTELHHVLPPTRAAIPLWKQKPTGIFPPHVAQVVREQYFLQ
jgi:hypothetical protein